MAPQGQRTGHVPTPGANSSWSAPVPWYVESMATPSTHRNPSRPPGRAHFYVLHSWTKAVLDCRLYWERVETKRVRACTNKFPTPFAISSYFLKNSIACRHDFAMFSIDINWTSSWFLHIFHWTTSWFLHVLPWKIVRISSFFPLKIFMISSYFVAIDESRELGFLSDINLKEKCSVLFFWRSAQVLSFPRLVLGCINADFCDDFHGLFL